MYVCIHIMPGMGNVLHKSGISCLQVSHIYACGYGKHLDCVCLEPASLMRCISVPPSEKQDDIGQA